MYSFPKMGCMCEPVNYNSCSCSYTRTRIADNHGSLALRVLGRTALHALSTRVGLGGATRMVGGRDTCGIQFTLGGWLHSPTVPSRCVSCRTGTAPSAAPSCCCVGVATASPAITQFAHAHASQKHSHRCAAHLHAVDADARAAAGVAVDVEVERERRLAGVRRQVVNAAVTPFDLREAHLAAEEEELAKVLAWHDHAIFAAIVRPLAVAAALGGERGPHAVDVNPVVRRELGRRLLRLGLCGTLLGALCEGAATCEDRHARSVRVGIRWVTRMMQGLRCSLACGSLAMRTDFLLVDADALGGAVRAANAAAVLAPVAPVALRRFRAVEVRTYDMSRATEICTDAVSLHTA